jgi:hypothetical protein
MSRIDEGVDRTIGDRRALRRPLGRWGIVFSTAFLAACSALIVHAVGRAVGATYAFTAAGGRVTVDSITVFGFAFVPVLIGMVIVALLPRRWGWVVPTALPAAVVVALGTIPLMVMPTDLDPVGKTALALCHVALLPAIVWGLLALRRLPPAGR